MIVKRVNTKLDFLMQKWDIGSLRNARGGGFCRRYVLVHLSTPVNLPHSQTVERSLLNIWLQNWVALGEPEVRASRIQVQHVPPPPSLTCEILHLTFSLKLSGFLF